MNQAAHWATGAHTLSRTLWHSVFALALWSCVGDKSGVATSNETTSPVAVEDTLFAKNTNASGAFAQVASIEYSADHTLIALVDGTRLMLIAADGTELSSASRVGSGPGEWRYPIWAGADSTGVAVVDITLLRFVKLHRDLSTAGEMPISELVIDGTVVGRLSDGALITLLDPPTMPPGIGRQQFATHVIRWRPGNASVDTITALPGTDIFVDPTESMFVKVPSGRVDWVAARDSIVVGGNGSDDSVFVQVAHKKLRWIHLRDLPVGGATDVLRTNTFIDEEISQVPNVTDRKRMRRTYDKVPIPNQSPRFERLLLDDRGWMWCGTNFVGPQRVWRAFSLTGEPMAQLRLPANARPRLVSHQSIIATTPDSDGFERIVRYRVP